MNKLLPILIWVLVIAVVFGILWWKGAFMRLSNYVAETKEELRKCTWPTADELKGSTVVVAVSIILLGGFTVIVDLAISQLVRLAM